MKLPALAKRSFVKPSKEVKPNIEKKEVLKTSTKEIQNKPQKMDIQKEPKPPIVSSSSVIYEKILTFSIPFVKCMTEICTSEERFIVFGCYNKLEIYDIYTSVKKPFKTFTGHADDVNAVLFLSSGVIISGSDDKTLKFWKTDGTVLRTQKVGYRVWCLLELHDGKIACSCGLDGKIIIFCENAEKIISLFVGHDDKVEALIQLPSNGYLVSGSADSKIKIWDIQAGKCIKTLTSHTAPVKSLCVLKKGGFASASQDKTIRIWDDEGKCLKTLTGHNACVRCVSSLQNGLLASGSEDKTIKLWNQEGKCVQTLRDHPSSVVALMELQNGLLISGYEYTKITLWNDNSSSFE